MTAPLPIEAVLPALLSALRDGGTAVLVAPPGAGKTTAIAPALLSEPWAGGKRILLLSPRRLAARAAAERMATVRGERVGDTVGYRTRMDSAVGPATRIEVLTEGIFTRLVQADPELSSVAAVLFDEVHERSIDGDLGLALALDVRSALRPDLRLLAMSATVDGAAYARLLGGPVITSAGRTFPVELRYLGRDPGERIEVATARAVHEALVAETGSILVFLPGAAEIERTAERLRLPNDTDLHTLYGALDAAVQRVAIEPAPLGRRKVVLATSIAETSLTIDGVRVVIDAGLARRPDYDRATGLTRLVTGRAAQANVIQRAGRAGRTAPGVAWRLWEAAATTGLPPYDPPAILASDLTGLMLELAAWGEAEPARLAWLDPPPAAAVAEARARLASFGAFDVEHRLTPHGRAMAALPLPPAQAHMLLAAAPHGLGRAAVEVAVLLAERGLGGRNADLETRRTSWQRERGQRADAARRLATRWLRMLPAAPEYVGEDATGAALALAYPDRIARSRRGNDGQYLMANGRAVRLDPADLLAKAEWLAVGEASGRADGSRVIAAAVLDRSTVDRLFADRIEQRADVRFSPETRGVVAEETERLGAIVLARRPTVRPKPDAIVAALLAGVKLLGIGALPWPAEWPALQARTAFARGQGSGDLPDLDFSSLLTDVATWLPPLLTDVRRLDDIEGSALIAALIDRHMRQRLDSVAPPQFTTPAASSHVIDYAAAVGPTVAVRVQALFGMDRHPTAGDSPLILQLLSPGGHALQTTRDLPGFWRGSWASVAAEMRGRYPRHPWPARPWEAAATLRTKRADART